MALLEILTGTDHLQAWLRRMLPEATGLDVAVGFLSPEGLTELADLVDDARIPVRVLAGRLIDGGDSARLIRPPLLALRRMPADRGLFHPKLYIVHRPDGQRAAIGSSNLTHAALHRNTELDIAIGGVGTVVPDRE